MGLSPQFNVEYEMAGRTLHWLVRDISCPVEAHQWAMRFNNRYYNKPRPNGNGVYPVSEARVVVIVNAPFTVLN
jgi:hypothetical protein